MKDKFWMSLINTLISLIRVIVLSRNNKLPKNLNTSINILGNAPNIKDQNIDTIYPRMVTNGFAIDLDYYLKTKPTYYVLCDDKYFEPKCYYTSAILDAINRRDWDMYIFKPRKSVKHDRVMNKNFRYNKTTIEGFGWFVLWCMKHNLGMPSPANVLIPCLMLAINMGYKEINLYGFEFSWYKEAVFGEKLESIHFHKEPEKYNYQDMETLLYTFYKTVYGLNIVKKYAKKRGVKIINHCDFKII